MVRVIRRRMRLLTGVLACSLYASGLPELPQVDTSDFLPIIRAQIAQATAAAKAHPRDAKVAGALAMTLHAYEQYDAAGRVYARAHALEPETFDWVYLLGAVQMAQGRFDSAIESFENALLLRPGDLITELRLADSLTAIAKWDEAGAHYRRILDKHANCAEAWYGLGRVQAATLDHRAALESFAKACELYPDYGVAQFALAGELRAAGKTAETQEHLRLYAKNVTTEPPLDDVLFKRIYELNIGVQSHLLRAAELEKAGLLREAIGENQAALDADASTVQAHINLISLFARTGDATEARQHFNAAIKLNPGSSDAWYNLGVLFFNTKEYDAAEDAYRHALEIDPDYAEAHHNLGIIYEHRGRLDGAEKEFRKAIASRPDYPAARFQLGRILVAHERYGDAIHEFLRALEPETELTPAYLYALGATYARDNDKQRALEYLGKARDAAAVHGQQQLVNSIDKDLKMLQSEP